MLLKSISGVETYKLMYNIEIGGHTKKSDKNNKKSKKLQLEGETRRIRINYFTSKNKERWSDWNFQNN